MTFFSVFAVVDTLRLGKNTSKYQYQRMKQDKFLTYKSVATSRKKR